MRADKWRSALAGLMIAMLAFGTSAGAQEDDGSFAYSYQAYMRAANNGDAKSMARYAGDAYERAQEVLEAGDIQLGYLAANYAEALVQDGKSSRAEPVFKDCVAILKEYFPETVPDVTYCWDGLGWTYVNRSDPDEAKEAFENALTVATMLPDDAELRKYRADTHLVAANIYMPPGTYYFMSELGDVAKERTYHHGQQAVALMPEYFGEESMEMAEAWMFVGYGAPADQRQEAADAYGNAWLLYSELICPEAPDTMFAYTRYRAATNAHHNYDDTKEEDDYEFPCTHVQPDGAVVIACKKKDAYPKFPDSVSRLDGLAVVELLYDIDELGRGDNARVIYSSHPKFGEASARSIRDMRFDRPVDERGNSVVVRDLTTIFKFQLVR